MALTRLHEIHARRFGRNLGVGLCLLAFVALVFGLTIAKVSGQGATEGFDHVLRPDMVPPAAEAPGE
ncbi:hypothetical protein [Mangrovicoccus algicola]|uniref:Uncharacterized protein n=1 Tax=Mangrovicoccus algicola TaxID=2771008 RepID=A0A8J6YU19_9RHOB|nr:hypothetical protein [Mangrovicoccus algicola]MBE3637787.1 hypothetical protein [Mangrovicoccus algicola]